MTWEQNTIDPMGANRKTATVSVGLVKILEAYARSMAVDFYTAASDCHFDPGILANGEARIPADRFVSLWLKIAVMGDDPHPGLSYGIQAANHYPSGSILFSLMRNCPNVEQALDVFVRYHRIMAADIRPVYRKEAEQIRLSWDSSAFDAWLPHLSEALLSTYYALFSKLTQGKIKPQKVCFTHTGPDRPEDVGAYDRAFGAPVFFRQARNELILNTRDLDIRIDLADASLYQVLETHAAGILSTIPPEHRLSTRVSQLIMDGIFSGQVPDMGAVAETLALGKRSLQEKLKNEGSSFRSLLQTVRKQVALDCLSTKTLSICELAFLLGYSDQSAFTHAFKRWTGKSPKVMQKQ